MVCVLACVRVFARVFSGSVRVCELCLYVCMWCVSCIFGYVCVCMCVRVWLFEHIFITSTITGGAVVLYRRMSSAVYA